MHVWRISADTVLYPADDLSGTGAKRSGGRWNAVGRAVLYASTTRALACLETVVHLNAGGLPFNRYLVEVAIPLPLWKAARRETADSLPVGWDAEPAGLTSIQCGSDWMVARDAAIMLVPSVIVPEEFNVLIDPEHPASAGITARKVRKWLYDPRLKAGA